MSNVLKQYRYLWPSTNFQTDKNWHKINGKDVFVHDLPESTEKLSKNSQWPAFFPSPICLVTTTDNSQVALEKVVGASIVNRFPYVLALSFCTRELSQRHHVRRTFTDMLERNGSVAVQFIPLGEELDKAMNAITTVPEEKTHTRIAYSGLATRKALTNDAPVFNSAYLVYEAKLVKPGKDFEGQPIYSQPWVDIGSHRVYFLEINTIQLRQDIAEGRSQILWRSLPAWQPQHELQKAVSVSGEGIQNNGYKKGYTPHYAFPSAGTIAFEADAVENGMAVKYLPPLPEEQVEVDNDKARWPCFFPSSAGMITCWAENGTPNLMPCGSTTIVSRHPLVITPCISYAKINERYAPRVSLDIIRKTGKFACGVPFINDVVINAIKYAGNTSLATDPQKVARAGLQVEPNDWSPVLPALPIHFDCQVIDEVTLGTHIMFLGEVRQIRVRADVTPENPIEWYPWADLITSK